MSDVYQYGLGLIRQSHRIFRFNKNIFKTPLNKTNISYCSCGDKTQPDLHEAKAIVLNCMDFRLRDNITCHLNIKGYKNNYDEVIAAGASLGYNGLSTELEWKTFIDEHIKVSYILHKINKIIIIEHEKCGAYKMKYGETTSSDEYTYHVENINKCGEELWLKFNQIDGNIIKIIDLTIIGYIISIDGCNLKELYRKQL